MFVFFAYFFSLIAIILAIKLHDKYDPARYYILLWGSQVIVVHLLFHNNFMFAGYGLVYISITCLLFSIGSITGRLLGTHVHPRAVTYIFNSKRALLLLKVSIIISIINVFWGIYVIGFNIKQIISFNILLELNHLASVTRYSGGVPTNLLSQITLIFVYLTPLIGGYLLPLVSGRNKYWSYLALLPPILITLTQAVKLGLITSVFLWAIGVLISSFTNNPGFFRVRFSAILKIGIYSILFFAILFISMVLRTGKFDMETITQISEKFVNYAFGHLPAFDLWCSQALGDIKPSWGIKTFYGISNMVGIAEREIGVFSEFMIYGKNDYSGMATNVYTMFRFILEDFGLLGSMILLYLTAVIGGYSWQMIRLKKYIFIFQTVQIAILFFISVSFVTSSWAYTSYIAVIIMFYFILVFTFSRGKANPSN